MSVIELLFAFRWLTTTEVALYATIPVVGSITLTVLATKTFQRRRSLRTPTSASDPGK